MRRLEWPAKVLLGIGCVAGSYRQSGCFVVNFDGLRISSYCGGGMKLLLLNPKRLAGAPFAAPARRRRVTLPRSWWWELWLS
jgi:hypothetical protein